MNYKIAVMAGDGVGPEIVDSALAVLNAISKKFGFTLDYTECLIGGIAYDKTKTPLPEETVKICRASDAILLGAVGGYQWDDLPGNKRPEAGLLGIRKALGLFANLRPAVVYKELIDASPLKPEIIGEGLDILVMRELTGGIYFGKKELKETSGYDVMEYTEPEVRRIAIKAFEAAMKRNKKVTSVDKANVLEVSKLWRKVVVAVSKDYPEVELNHLYVDNAAMQLVIRPTQFDVIVTGNMFGDILSDEASMITGSIGMLPSASLGDGTIGLYEPIHGSAPDIVGQNICNPIATILSVAMMLRYSLNQSAAAEAIEKAISATLANGYRTNDIHSKGTELVGTKEITQKILEFI